MITRRNATGRNGRRTSIRRLFLPERGHCIVVGLFIAASSGILLGQGVTEFDVPYGQTSPRGITPGADDNIWFADYLGQAIVRLTPAGVFTRFSVPTTYASPMGATLGPDVSLLKLWATETFQRIADLVIEVAGPAGGAAGPVPLGGDDIRVLGAYYRARPSIDVASAGSTIAGNSVTMSMRMATVPGRGRAARGAGR